MFHLQASPDGRVRRRSVRTTIFNGCGGRLNSSLPSVMHMPSTYSSHERLRHMRVVSRAGSTPRLLAVAASCHLSPTGDA